MEIENDSRDVFEEAFREVVGTPEKKPSEFASKTRVFEPNLHSDFLDDETSDPAATADSKDRIKSSLRMKYEAEVAQIKKRHGNLEDIRRLLGLSQRKICQLLMVDPSAWSRWNGPKSMAPPHIYRSLQWYLLLQNKDPQMKASLFLNTMERPQLSHMEIQKIKRDLEPTELINEIFRLKKRLKVMGILQAITIATILLILTL